MIPKRRYTSVNLSEDDKYNVRNSNVTLGKSFSVQI
jgi:hypothetical protein